MRKPDNTSTLQRAPARRLIILATLPLLLVVTTVTRVTAQGAGPWHVGVVGGIDYYWGGDMDKSTTLGLTGGFHDIRGDTYDLFFNIELLIRQGDYDAGATHGGLIDNVVEYDIGFSLNNWLVKRHEPLGVYVLSGGRFGLVTYDYAGGLDVTNGITKTIDSDFVMALELYAGLGAALLQMHWLQIAANGTVGYRFYLGDNTNEGVRNDFFRDEGVVQLFATVMFGQW